MTIEQAAAAFSVALPLVKSAIDIAQGLFTGAIGAAQAKAQIRALCAVTVDRLDKADDAFKRRDAEQDARVEKLIAISTLLDPSK